MSDDTSTAGTREPVQNGKHSSAPDSEAALAEKFKNEANDAFKSAAGCVQLVDRLPEIQNADPGPLMQAKTTCWQLSCTAKL